MSVLDEEVTPVQIYVDFNQLEFSYEDAPHLELYVNAKWAAARQLEKDAEIHRLHRIIEKARADVEAARETLCQENAGR